MQIVKKLNNSVVIAKDPKGQEVVITGKGIGVHYSKGSFLKEEDVDKVYILQDDKASNDVIQLTGEVSGEFFSISSKIIDYAKGHLQADLNDHIYVSLTDHIHYAVERHEKNIVIQNRLFWEVKKFYPKEFEIGLYALNILYEELNILFPEEEAGNIAFHLVNAQHSPEQATHTSIITTVIKDVMNIVAYHFRVSLDYQSLNYTRFVTHLQFFAQRLIEKEETPSSDGFLFDQIREKYKEEYQCAIKINHYILTSFNRTVSNDELIYLTLHINRLINRQ
ncbi:transcription antiterminator BglG [Rossellomorea marisflavi]|uniref:BglG family transcription antiterminator LicT n=1 Tax=Rossellomorea marisflavi TaxID=189381 RepID=UPI0025CAA846|nr:PRD domain-containing protein [Rossellomorea marisflavi]UTE73100.1 PRD domain-containing protein [Rossellomorea marisflavi]GLI84266.1 transcription antiterminator BglG [Rossellomorea marisflavi]